MMRAAATPIQVRLRMLLSGYRVRRASIHSPSSRWRSGVMYHRRNSQIRKSAGVVLEGEGRQRRRVIRMEGAYLLPVVSKEPEY